MFLQAFFGIFQKDLKPKKILHFLVPILIFKYFFWGSLSYFLETLKPNLHAKEQNIEEGKIF